MDAAESLLAPEILWPSLLCPSASPGTQPSMPADCAATLASRRVELACLPLWKLNHEFQWLAIDTDMDGAAMVRRSTNSVAASWIRRLLSASLEINSAAWRSYRKPWRSCAEGLYSIEMGELPKLYKGKVSA